MQTTACVASCPECGYLIIAIVAGPYVEIVDATRDQIRRIRSGLDRSTRRMFLESDFALSKEGGMHSCYKQRLMGR